MVRPRLFDVEKMKDDLTNSHLDNDLYQEDDSTTTLQPEANDDDNICLREANAEINEIPINEIFIPLNFDSSYQRINEGESDEENYQGIQHYSDSDSE
jgi:hypothetical protein